MKIHAVASQPHYHAHVEAVWRHLHPSLRGASSVGRGARAPVTDEEDVYMVASHWDFDRLPDGAPVIYVEHGAGQSYGGDPDSPVVRHPSYHGSKHAANVIGYISPRPSVAESWDPVPAFAAGAPIVDQYAGANLASMSAVITFHWKPRLARFCPEMGTARPHWQPHLLRMVDHLKDQGFQVYGHHHPRDLEMPGIWRRLGVPVVDADFVYREAGLLIADNTSLMYELAYLRCPVVALNAPEWRRDIQHGLRFWSACPGVQLDDWSAFDSFDFAHYMESILGSSLAMLGSLAAYDQPFSDGQDGSRAAGWIHRLVAER